MRRLIITMLVSVLTAMLVQAGSAAGGPPCLVSKERSGPPARSLQAGVDAAAAGDTLIVRGTCIGTATITKDLTLRGVSSGPFVATLDGNGVGPVLSVTGTVVVAIDNLLVTNGTTGIAESFGGTLTVSHSTVSGNSGRGVLVHQDSTLTLDNSTVSANEDGGIASDNGSILTLNGSSVSGNTSSGGAGIFAFNGGGGTVTLNNSTVSGNTATQSGGGGGMFFFFGTVTLNDSSINGNTAIAGNGGGVVDIEGTAFILNGTSTVNDNVAGLNGGGIYVVKISLGTLVNCISGVNVAGNSPDNIFVHLFP
jgi:predicted outer membrane repeat protein